MKGVVKWHKIASATYGLGVWTMIGSYFYFSRFQDKPVEKNKEEEEDDRNKVVYKTKHTETVIIYKKDFVPYPTRISNFFESLFK